VHLLIETRGLRFLLTGSSARKLRRSGVNLLGGRARARHLHPFSWKELGGRFERPWREFLARLWDDAF
jgi:predicted AAA+ superfamily ATPase